MSVRLQVHDHLSFDLSEGLDNSLSSDCVLSGGPSDFVEEAPGEVLTHITANVIPEFSVATN
jgi:hypothetical protein